MLQAVLATLRSTWKSLAITDILARVITFVFLTPLVSLLFRVFLAMSGRTVLADADIARFLLHPLGWTTAIILGAAVTGVLALEQSALMAISVAHANGRTVNIPAALWFVACRAGSVFHIPVRIAAFCLLIATPFLAVAGGIFLLLLLTEHDINFYLTAKPPSFLVATALIGVTAIQTVRLDADVAITAHRAGAGVAPENTLAAVRQAIADQTDWIEIDVQKTRDGVVVVAHDSDLRKVAGVSTKIWDATAAELQAIDIGSFFAPEFRDERVPTLADVLDAWRGKVGVNIELKYYGQNQDLERKVVDLVEQYDNVVIMSLEIDGIRKIRELRPEWTVGLLTAVVAGDLTRMDVDFLAVNFTIASRSFIRSARANDKAVYTWTVNDPVTMFTMISRGVDHLITDDPALARRVLREPAGMSPMECVLVEFSFLFGAVPPAPSIQ